MLMEYAPNGTVFEYLFARESGFGEEIIRALFFQLMDGLNAIHSAGYAHRDIKFENVLFG